MTDDIAYKLGKFDFPCFYSIAMWRVNKEPFELAHFFEWTIPGGFGGWTCKKVDEQYITDWENVRAGGKLKLEEFKEITHKLAYIKGKLSGCRTILDKNKIDVGWANSYEFRDFFAKCLEDVIWDKFVLAPPTQEETARNVRSFTENPLKFKIMKHEQIGLIPGCPRVTLEADEEIIKYIAEI